MFKELFRNENFKPDQLKIYPCQVIEGAALKKLFEAGKYKPYSKEEIEKLLIKIMKIIPNYCRIMRIMREIPPEYLVAGTTRIDLRKDIDKKLKMEKTKNKIKEIRFREIGFALRDMKKGENIDKKLRLKITKYKASGGDEYFLEFVNKQNVLFGLCRLRIFKNRKSKQAFIRELHVYGKSLPVKSYRYEEEDEKIFSVQHRGLGKKLIKKAEEICEKNKIKKLRIISGVGVREYYKKLGYKLDKKNIYMEKNLDIHKKY